MADLISPKSTTIITAALESAGATIQSDMLDYVATSSGQTLAGFLYMLSIISALFIFASGGNYRWGRYLLVGPVLFFFLTTVRTDSDGTKWSFGDTDYSQEAVTKALRGVDSPSSSGKASVALFYNWWNVFLSELNYELIKLLNLTETDSNFNFVQKVERVMKANFKSMITDPQLRSLIQLTLSGQCKSYFHHLRVVNNPHSLRPDRSQSQTIVNTLKDRVVLKADKDGLGNILDASLHDWMLQKGLLNKSYTCQEMWEVLLAQVQNNVSEGIEKESTQYLSPEQDTNKSRKTFYRHWNHFTELYSGRGQEYEGRDAQALAALDWLSARSLYIEIWQGNPYIQEQVSGAESDFFQMGEETFLPGKASSYNENAAGAIKQFNVTDKYAERGEYVSAALSLPYFQGMGLMILSAAYPFFAMLVVMPGRAIGFLTWMGLWAWLKLWDLGFAVVMLIDNMLYAMFPKGPNVEPGELKDAGIAWSKMLEVDSNYSQAIYYNILSTCLFAVPLVTAIFVRGGGKELVNIINQGWSSHALRVAGAPASYARSFQAQGYMMTLQNQIFKDVQSADEKFLADNKGRIDKIKALESQIKTLTLNNPVTDLKVAELKSDQQAIVDQLKADRVKVLSNTAYASEMKYGQYAANRAVAARYYSHDLVQNRAAAYDTMFQAELTKGFYNQENIGEALTKGIFAPIKFTARSMGGFGN